jgi:nucleotide-binding universal stress UspA family protein
MTTQILVPLHTYPDGNSANISHHVRSVARHLGGAVHALLLNADFPPIGSPLANLILDAAALVEGAKAQSRKNGEALLNDVRSELEQHKIDLRCTQAEYFPTELTDTVTDIARYHDLTILGIGNHDAALRGTAEEVIFAAGKPVLLVPEDLESKSYDHVVIAWDGSRVAARAIGDAWPFLAKATAISILSVTDEKALPRRDVGARLADYLDKHGMSATVSNIATEDRPIAETLQTHALGIGAGMLVMGGFGHSRMRDFVLGGATSGILRDLKLPALISH